jgi:hypothetical protein
VESESILSDYVDIPYPGCFETIVIKLDNNPDFLYVRGES